MISIDINGARLDVTRTGTGRDLILLHSLLTDGSVFDRVLPALSRNHRVWVADLPGYGDSSPAGGSVEDYADRIAGLLAALNLPRETDILGNGFGGFIATSLAARHGARFDRLIVADALVSFPTPAKQPLRMLAEKVSAEGMTGALDIAIRRMFPDAFVAAHPEIVAERRNALQQADAKCFANACIALANLDFSPVLGNIRNRTLVMVGNLDVTTPPAGARELADRIPDATYQEIPGCGHCPQIEDPQAFVEAVVHFLGD